VTLVGGDPEAAAAAVTAAFAAPDARAADLTAAESATAAALLRERYRDAVWHAGPWHDVTPDDVRAVLGA
jgi:hypothetical protein